MDNSTWEKIVKAVTHEDGIQFNTDLNTDIGDDEMNNQLMEMRTTAEKRQKMEDEMYAENKAEMQLIEELEEDWREKEYIKVSFPKNYLDLIQGHLRMYERLMGKKEREELQEAIYWAYVK